MQEVACIEFFVTKPTMNSYTVLTDWRALLQIRYRVMKKQKLYSEENHSKSW